MNSIDELWEVCESVLLADGRLADLDVLNDAEIVNEYYDDPKLFNQIKSSLIPVSPQPALYLALSMPNEIKEFLKMFNPPIEVERPAKKNHPPVKSTVYLKVRGTGDSEEFQSRFREGIQMTESQYVKAILSKNEFGGGRIDPKTGKEWDGLNLFRVSMHRPKQKKESNFIVGFCPTDESLSYLHFYGQDLLTKTNHHPWVKDTIDAISASGIDSFLTKRKNELMRKQIKQSPDQLFRGSAFELFGPQPVLVIKTVPIENGMPWTFDEFMAGSIWKISGTNKYFVFPKSVEYFLDNKPRF